MRIHSDTLTRSDLASAARVAGVAFTRCEARGSRSRAGAFDVILTGASTRRQNGGTDYAATWDQWGEFLAAVFRADPRATVPNVYPSGEAFHWLTGSRYDGREYAAHAQHRWNYDGENVTGVYRVYSCKCGAVSRGPVGKLADTLARVGIDTGTGAQ
ncbi:hypothetical protein SEA_BRAXOADDIE_89 [Rhodococcus phage Braxoaddie]|nr:hypothetical protein SEA_BRAXOADDIE_89 [Rhodococcus phage Braxoaddie]WNM67472.1 hypothetical protein SEA_POLYYUKI_88 [Rhodococcus phage Polyyuki]